MSTFTGYFENLSQKSLTALCLLLVLIIGTGDFLTGPEIGFSFFYVVPIYLMTWFGGSRQGILFSFISASAWFTNTHIMYGVPNSSSFIPYWDTFVRLGFYLTIVFLESSLKDALSRATTDPLTSVGNRRYFFDSADLEIKKFLRYDRPFTAAYIDIDDFKGINDNFGHDAGDNLLKAVAHTISENVRSTDIFARLGGDEFAILLTETGEKSARILIPKIHELLSEMATENKWPVTFSIGVVTFFKPPASVHELIKKVDVVMYSAKKSGRNLIRYDIHGLKPAVSSGGLLWKNSS